MLKSSFLPQVFHKIITSGHQRLQPLFDCLLTIVVNGEHRVGRNHSPQCSHSLSLCPCLCSLTLASACYGKLILSSLFWIRSACMVRWGRGRDSRVLELPGVAAGHLLAGLVRVVSSIVPFQQGVPSPHGGVASLGECPGGYTCEAFQEAQQRCCY